MKCPHTNCTKCDDCTILDIIKKIPVSIDKCSYSITKTQLEKQEIKEQKKATKTLLPKKPKFKRDKSFKGKKHKKEVSGDE
jgi:Na+-translocating ferredoxin:NAD+ oxidoreductase RnfG subunit